MQAEHARRFGSDSERVSDSRGATATPPAPTRCSTPSMCMRISPESMIIVSSVSGWMCSGVTLPWLISTSKSRNAPPVSSSVAFQVWVPPPKNQRISPSPAARITGLAALAVVIIHFLGLPAVSQVAELAGISRTTAYRYFPDQRSLLMAAHPETATASLLPPNPPTDPAARLALVTRAFTDLIVETEPQQRTMLRLSLEATPIERDRLPLRRGRAIGWIAEALAPLEDVVGERQLRLLVLAIRSAIGIEALTWLTDIAELSRSDAVRLMRWSAQSLFEAALTNPPVDGDACA